MIKIGRIPYLVCAPFFHSIVSNTHLQVQDGVPTALNQLLLAGELDGAPSSSICYAQNPALFCLSAKWCTASTAEVQSVLLFSHKPIQQLAGSTILLTQQSATSVALLKILLQDYLQLQPLYLERTSTPSQQQASSALLLIGDEALATRQLGSYPYVYDLASLWRDWTNLPFVFGAWIFKRPTSISMAQELLHFNQYLTSSITNFLADPATGIQNWGKQYKLPAPQKQCLAYFKAIDYNFSTLHKQSLLLFYKKAAELQLIPSWHGELVFLEDLVQVM
jgi:chorismate dehydratase